ncbi:hypothetical protein EYF80_035774 [Liparis tanakae]|uniref:Uncharacterized protein n=1 Tax=Liparis tanakae TaxID=230148 RepID=A0A4Z2GKM0_9TELE|nr:hypothetical protein EYF80_035774 [Liparis tanakae]
MGVIEQRKLESQKEGCPLKNQEMRLQDANCSPPRISSLHLHSARHHVTEVQCSPSRLASQQVIYIWSPRGSQGRARNMLAERGPSCAAAPSFKQEAGTQLCALEVLSSNCGRMSTVRPGCSFRACSAMT